MSAEEAVRGATLEASVVALFPWIAYMLAEALELVGIVSILFCGVVMGHYTRRNLSEGGRALTLGAFGLMAQLSETFVFIYIGASVFLAQPRYFATAAWTVVMCLASRAVAVYPGAKLINGRAAGAGSNPTHAAAGTSASDGFRVGGTRGGGDFRRRRAHPRRARPHALVQRSTRRDGVRARARGGRQARRRRTRHAHGNPGRRALHRPRRRRLRRPRPGTPGHTRHARRRERRERRERRGNVPRRGRVVERRSVGG